MSRFTDRKKFKFKGNMSMHMIISEYAGDPITQKIMEKLFDYDYFFLDVIVDSDDYYERGHAINVWGENGEEIKKSNMYPLIRSEIEKYFEEISEVNNTKSDPLLTHQQVESIPFNVHKFVVNVHPDEGKPFILGGEDSPFSYDEAVSLVKEYFLSNYSSTRFDKVLLSKVENEFRRDDFELTLKSK